MTLLDPTFSMKNLSYIGYGGEPTSAICVTRKSSSTDCQLQQQPGRNVFQCFVFGPKKSGKSALLDSFLIRSLNRDDTYIPTSDDRHYAVNDVDQCRGAKKFLVLREFPEDTVGILLLSGGKALAACDVAVFVYDTSDVSLKNGSTNLLKKVDQHCKDSGVPFRYVAAKIFSLSFVIQQASQDTLLPISTELGSSNEVFYEIAKSTFRSFRVDSSDDSRVGLQEII
ncbi:hypothetical protein FEM48_Zijuj07G0086700 [Ziziphus jujuba var. spinosa]|uniref:Mitochondrial Rho GTPase 1-like n=1 Tax=Ziziphus jujuba var. spinosa TaxID=714518 RepID=A0A978V3M0_ZIZJJ|nr:hypothetical protein FEM48_Zijuj07G0086700 [Ziziphus jujuba var. spinosa]